MGRLIDADKCPCILCEDTRNAHCTYEHRSCEKFCNWLNNITFDEEKVVAELEKLKQHNKELSEGAYLEEDKSFYFCAYTNFARAIGIVRKGGVK